MYFVTATTGKLVNTVRAYDDHAVAKEAFIETLKDYDVDLSEWSELDFENVFRRGRFMTQHGAIQIIER
jgi:hypothetical protein